MKTDLVSVPFIFSALIKMKVPSTQVICVWGGGGGPKNDVLKTISSQLIFRISVENPPPPPQIVENHFANFQSKIRPFFAIFGVKIHK